MNPSAGTILITGASSGLGRAAAKLFRARGWRVIATMRDPGKEQELAALDGIELVRLDVTDPAQIAAAVDVGIRRRVDVVFNNAGYGMAGPLEGVTDAQLLRMIDTNLLGAIRMTQGFIPFFRELGRGLFINTTSIGGLVTVPFNSIYHATKWALEGWSESLAFELAPFGIGVKTVAPGGMQTDFFSRSFETAEHPAYTAMVDRVMAAFADPGQQQAYSTPGSVAEIVYQAATDDEDQVRYLAGQDAVATLEARRSLGDEPFRQVMRQRFFG